MKGINPCVREDCELTPDTLLCRCARDPSVLRTATAALAYVSGLVHRDLKPANIVLEKGRGARGILLESRIILKHLFGRMAITPEEWASVELFFAMSPPLEPSDPSSLTLAHLHREASGWTR